MISSPTKEPAAFEWATLAALMVIGIFMICARPHPIVYDQGFIRFDFTSPAYPAFDNGISSLLTAGVYNRIVHPAPDRLDAHIRSLALVLYALAGFLLAREVLGSLRGRILFLAFMFLSKYWFLWLSSELFTGAFLFFALWAMLRSYPIIAMISLVLFGLAKADPVLTSVALFIYWYRSQPVGPPRRRALAVYLGIFGVLLLPGLLVHGRTFTANRSLSAFGQHYAMLHCLHEGPVPGQNPWTEWRFYLDQGFPGVTSMLDVVIRYPLKYAGFLLMTFAYSFRNALFMFGPLLAVLVAAPFWWRKSGLKGSFFPLCAVTLIGLLPILALSFLHVRYLARFYPLGILVALFMLENARNKRERFIMLGLVVVTLGWTIFQFWQPRRLIFWSPD